MSTATLEALLTAEEFYRLPDDGRRTELVRGKVVEMPPTGKRHGKTCAWIAHLLITHAVEHDCGTVMSNDAGVVTERDPDSVRAPDLSFFSYDRLPKDDDSDGYAEVVPNVVFEVRSPSERWKAVLRKVNEYIEGGALAVCIVDPDECKVYVFRPDAPVSELSVADELLLPEIPPGFRVPVARLFPGMNADR
jgi:Uma2 family endonuclease